MATINGQQVDIKNTSLLDYLVSNGFDADRLAVEVNGDIVKRGTYGDYIINEYDKIEIVCFVGGG
ncbi:MULTISPECIES: sulfur carrier protein ThiS [Peptostreptococcus]|jgi:sulfur carrier protein|uniref:Sulfur carrier protein ThiS n=1 Tax=Peptostreptococcus anaerobius TaxID=1261 RepID=A0A379CII4_9FIRM|nr:MULTISPECIES: sulfur carrier protein ThiS [Peptostreptococcus]EKX95379.1 thiamine biosynthesis protein ThiS [Peptostreptococcus anaerobius VPI 4330 = DSM 2949]KXB73726.1 thiamine biosynthesis protein ThiS [Peptostreptococcus anaerobius]MBS5596244.1 sulfur carrier protein ThiS [Peptostreptococcus sp.]MDB8851750.1 sulfur carrier protein ThiS [Peptostreptococcus anaerobius]MDK8278506.1 sulfur carrier protein ThiS [Peptostreptococcus anaerobius]